MRIKNHIAHLPSYALKELEPNPWNFKTIEDRFIEKLRTSLEKNGMDLPLYVWKRGKKIIVIKGCKRLHVLKRMEERGYTIDKVPVVELDLKNEKEAIEAVHMSNTVYAKMTNTRTEHFMVSSNITLEEIDDEVSFPELDLSGLTDEEEQETGSGGTGDGTKGATRDEENVTIALLFTDKDYKIIMGKIEDMRKELGKDMNNAEIIYEAVKLGHSKSKANTGG